MNARLDPRHQDLTHHHVSSLRLLNVLFSMANLPIYSHVEPCERPKMSADRPDKPGETLRLLTTQVAGGLEQAREKLRALAKEPAASLAELDRLNATSRAITEAIDARARSAIDLFGIEESQKRMAAIGKEFAEARARQQEMLDGVARNFETLRSAAVSGFPLLGTTDPSRILDDSIDRFAARIPTPPANPIYETNFNLVANANIQREDAR